LANARAERFLERFSARLRRANVAALLAADIVGFIWRLDYIAPSYGLANRIFALTTDKSRLRKRSIGPSQPTSLQAALVPSSFVESLGSVESPSARSIRRSGETKDAAKPIAIAGA